MNDKFTSTDDIKQFLKEQKKLERERRIEEERIERIQSNESWLRELKFDKKGEKLTKTLTNYICILERCPDLGTFSFDT
jgi:poly-D-alanine transfer protein DltD